MSNFRVLIVDDEDDFREVIAKQLTRKGLACAGAPNGQTAIEMVKASGPYDVVLLDVKMPGMDGVATLQELKKIAPMTEVVMLTGHASVESGINGIKFGAFDYLMKPIDLEPLLAKLSAAYERRRGQQEKIKMAQAMKDMGGPV
jgi:DNA-binding NtrC family response regulator